MLHVITDGEKYPRRDEIKFAEDSLQKIELI